MINEKETTFQLIYTKRRAFFLILTVAYLISLPLLVKIFFEKQVEPKTFTYILFAGAFFVFGYVKSFIFKKTNNNAELKVLENKKIEITTANSTDSCLIKDLKFDYYSDGSGQNLIMGYIGPILEIKTEKNSFKIGTVNKALVWKTPKRNKYLPGPDYMMTPFMWYKLIRIFGLEKELHISLDLKMDFVDKPKFLDNTINQIAGNWKLFILGTAVAVTATVVMGLVSPPPADTTVTQKQVPTEPVTTRTDLPGVISPK